MKAIETPYNGHRFRSRTEARWAVFFDALGIKYEYELEGFELSSQWKYLPDFYLPTFIAAPAWVEVKGIEPNADEISKAVLLNQQSKKDVLIFIGVPDPKNSSFWITSRGEFRIIKGDQRSVFSTLDASFRHGTTATDAALTAKGARFEFGETPTMLPQKPPPLITISQFFLTHMARARRRGQARLADWSQRKNEWLSDLGSVYYITDEEYLARTLDGAEIGTFTNLADAKLAVECAHLDYLPQK